jgi:hypothetical protein
LTPAPRGYMQAIMAGRPCDEPCAAHNCLAPRWMEGFCAAHWCAHRALVTSLGYEDASKPDSLLICEAIWAAS